MSSSKDVKLSESEIIQRYNAMKQELASIATKIGDLELERDEHQLVLDTIGGLEKDRKCFRLVGGVLVEKTVGDVHPAVQKNFEGISKLITTLATTYKTKETAMIKFQQEHNIRVKA